MGDAEPEPDLEPDASPRLLEPPAGRHSNSSQEGETLEIPEPEPDCSPRGQTNDPDPDLQLFLALATCPFKDDDDWENTAKGQAKDVDPQRASGVPLPSAKNAFHTSAAAAMTQAELIRRSVARGDTELFSSALKVVRCFGASASETTVPEQDGSEASMEPSQAAQAEQPQGLSPQKGSKSTRKLNNTACIRRLQFALALPDDCPHRRDALAEAVALAENGALEQEPEEEESCDARGLLNCARSELGLSWALDGGSLEI